jgi:NAD-dependent dihydropyrimidine dehydrogenase PreA subunit
MATLTGLTFGSKEWLPKFVQAINQHKCIGCARCFKVCGRGVLGGGVSHLLTGAE